MKKKMVLRMYIHDDRDKQKTMKAVSRLVGVDSISVNMKLGQLTVIGDLDPIELVGKLRKQFPADLVSVGSAKEEKKKVVLQFDIHDDRDKQQAIKAVLRFVGYDSISVNMKLGQLTVIGDLDPIEVADKLRKQFPADVSVGSAKEEKKKVVLQFDIHVDWDKQKAIKAVSHIVGVDSISVKQGQWTVIGDLNPVKLLHMLRKKQFPVYLVSFGPAKEEKKADDKRGGGEKQLPVELTNKYDTYPAILYNNIPPPYEDNPNVCVIY